MHGDHDGGDGQSDVKSVRVKGDIVKKAVKKYQIEIMVFCLFIVELVMHIPYMEELDSWCTTYYTIGYEFGFSSRLLIGTLTRVLFPQLYASDLYVLLILIGVILSAVAAVVIGKYVRLIDADLRPMGMYLCALWLASPASISYLFQQSTFGRMDTFLVLYTLLIFLVAVSSKRAEKWILITGLVILAVLTHQVYVFILFPLPAAIFVYEFFANDKKEYLKYGVLLFGVCFGLALYLQVFSDVNCNSAQEMFDYAITHTSIQNVNLTVLQFEYFGEFSDHWNSFGQYMIAGCIKCGLASCVLLLPLWLLIFSIFRNYLRRTERSKKFGAWLMLACHVAYIPIFIITVDWGRWFAGLLMFDLLLIMYLLIVREPAMVACLKEKYEKAKRNPLPYILLLVYLAAQGKYDAIDVSSSAKRLVDYVEQWLIYLS